MKQERPEPVRSILSELFRNDLVGVDVGPFQRGDASRVDMKG